LRGTFVVAILVAVVATYLYYAEWVDGRRRVHEYEMKQLEIEHSIHRAEEFRAQSTAQASMPRTIQYNTARGRLRPVSNDGDGEEADTDEQPIVDRLTTRYVDPIVITRQGHEISQRRVIEFVVESLKPNGAGLVVSRWKADQHWDQVIVEQMLDYLADLGLITPRSNGRACSWLDESLRPADVLRLISQDQGEDEIEHDTVVATA
jgi:hypothetical protein